MKKVVIALLAALMVGSTFLTACGGEPQSSATQNVEASADELLRDIVENFPSAYGITVAPTYNEVYSTAHIFSDDMDMVGSISTDGNNVILRMDLTEVTNGSITSTEQANAMAYGMVAIFSTMTPSISESAVNEIQNGAIQVIGGSGAYSKKVGDVTYFVTESDDGEYINFIAS